MKQEGKILVKKKKTLLGRIFVKTLNLDFKGLQNSSGNIKVISFCKGHILLYIIESYIRKFSD